jgi:hypothetical protein
MLSIKRGDSSVHLYVWDRASGRLTKLSDRGVSLKFHSTGFAWLDNERLAVIFQPAGNEIVPINLEQGMATVATHEWSKAWLGK